MNWNIIGSLAWGFFLPIAILTVGGVFVYLGVAFKLDKGAAGIGFGLCFGTLILAVAMIGAISLSRS